ncbi:MAG: hypothetical protein ACREOJ_19545 [Gemmatimonadaceae bacterium]
MLDIGIDSVSSAAVNGEYRAMVTLSKHSDIPFPVELRLKLGDGSTQDARLPALIWKDGDRYVAAIPVRGAVVGARLWPDPTVPDWNDANDAWGDAPPAEPAGPVTSGGLTSLVNGGR